MKASPIQKQREQSGTPGTASIHEGFRVPDTVPPIGNNREQTETSDLLRVELLASYAHEIAHSAVALHYGCEVVVEISYDPATRYFDGVCYCRHPDGELPPEAARAIALAGIVGEAAYWLGWDNPRLTPDRLADSIRAGRVTVSPGDLRMAAGWLPDDMARAFGIVRNAWVWIVGEVEERARQYHGRLFVPAVPDAPKTIGNVESLAPQGMPLVPAVPDEKKDEPQND
ncbi:MAG: hypothetical protein RKP46_12465 [Candidatus Accumulibacter sp.]|uniref:hypothetical protein n=1 Tax=Accumulibacter sp. TaxID=2053492 RepID=UPI0028782A85|nr:hypothetical protein [Accumulibacter sp.]MDS4015143.1 hypothetical protein [Accumulibacter sp.]